MKDISRRQFVQSVTLAAGTAATVSAVAANAAGASTLASAAGTSLLSNSQKVALVTGGNRGLGLETVRQLGALGVKVLLGARNLETGEAKAAELRASGYDVQAVAVDLNDQASIEAAARTIDARHGRLDILVNNAGIADDVHDGIPSKIEFKAAETIFTTNFLGTLMVSQIMLPLIKKSKQGRIVNVSSEVGSLAASADPNSTPSKHAFTGYAASKAAVNMLTVQLAYELRDTNIKVNAICPGFVKTDMNHGAGAFTVEEGVTATMRYALIGDDGPNGGFFNAAGPLPW